MLTPKNGCQLRRDFCDGRAKLRLADLERVVSHISDRKVFTLYRIWRTGQHIPTKNSQEYPPPPRAFVPTFQREKSRPDDNENLATNCPVTIMPWHHRPSICNARFNIFYLSLSVIISPPISLKKKTFDRWIYHRASIQWTPVYRTPRCNPTQLFVQVKAKFMEQNFDYVTIYPVLCPRPVHDFHFQDNGRTKSQNNWAEISEAVYGLKVGETFNLHKSLQKLLAALIVTQNTS